MATYDRKQVDGGPVWAKRLGRVSAYEKDVIQSGLGHTG
jgi:hypothetical protein